MSLELIRPLKREGWECQRAGVRSMIEADKYRGLDPPGTRFPIRYRMLPGFGAPVSRTLGILA